MAKNDWQLVSDFRTFCCHMEKHAKNDSKSRFKKRDAKPFLRVIHAIISIFRLHFPLKPGMNGLPQKPGINTKIAHLHAANRYLSSFWPNRINAEGLEVWSEIRCLKDIQKELTHRPVCRQGQAVFCHNLSETLRINIYFDVTCDRYQVDSQHFNGHMSQVTFPLTSKSHRQREQGKATRGGIIRPLSQQFFVMIWHTPLVV